MKVRLRRFWFDLTHPKEWSIVMWYKEIRHKIKDYDRMKNDYETVVNYATNGNMSKSTYDVNTVCAQLDQAQQACYYQIISDDLNDIINDLENNNAPASLLVEELKAFSKNLVDQKS